MGIPQVGIFHIVPVLTDTIPVMGTGTPIFVWCLTKPTVSHIPTYINYKKHYYYYIAIF